MVKIPKKLLNARQQIDAKKFYPLEEAIELAKKTSYTKFDGSIDLIFNLNLDVRQANQQLRGSVLLPNGTGKKVKILVATEDAKERENAQKLGANIIVNAFELTEIIKSEKFNFDLIVTNPKMMPILGKFGKILGPKGLMPNPKTGTVTQNISKAIEDIKKGKANYRNDKEGIVHTMIGKVSMNNKKLLENAQIVIDTIIKLKPIVVKGTYLQNLTISTTMGPSIKVLIKK